MRRPAAAVILTASLFTLFLTVHALAGPFEDAKKAYERGDYETAYRLFKSLAEQGNANAQYNLGVMYGKGEGVPHDYVLAHMWFNLAAKSLSDADNRGKAARNRGFAASKMTPAQLAEAQRLAREWKPKKEKGTEQKNR